MAAPCPKVTPPAPFTLHMQQFFFLQTHLGGLSFQPWRRADAPWSPWAAVGAGAHGPLLCLAVWLSLMSQWPLVGTSAISHCSLRSLPEHPGCKWGLKWWQLWKNRPLPFRCCRQLVWACGPGTNAEPPSFSGPPVLLGGVPVLGITFLGASLPVPQSSPVPAV